MFSQDSQIEKNAIESADVVQSRERPGTNIKGRLFTNDFARYLKGTPSSRSRAYSFSDTSTLANVTRSVLFRIGQEPVAQATQQSSSVTKITDQSILSEASQIGIDFSPFVEKKSGTSASRIISSAEKLDRSPLQPRSPLQEDNPYVRSSGWIQIDPKNKKEDSSRTESDLSQEADYIDDIDDIDDIAAEEYALNLENTEQKPNSTKRKASLNNSSIKKKSAKKCAQAYVKNLKNLGKPIPFFLTDSQEDLEWAHIMAKSIDTSRATDPRNLVVMTKTLNTWMLFFETIATILAKTFEDQGITVKVRSMVEVCPQDTDIAKTLQYQIRCSKEDGLYIELEKMFNLEKDSHKYLPPRVSDKHIVCEAFADILNIALLKKPASSSSTSQAGDEKEITQAIETFQNLIGFVCVFTTGKKGSSIYMEKKAPNPLYINAFDMLLSKTEHTVVAQSEKPIEVQSVELGFAQQLPETEILSEDNLNDASESVLEEAFLAYTGINQLANDTIASPLVPRSPSKTVQHEQGCALSPIQHQGTESAILFSPFVQPAPFSDAQRFYQSFDTTIEKDMRFRDPSHRP